MSKQLLAKIGVFALIVVNLGAYYLFWPDNGGRGPGLDKADGPSPSLQVAATASAAQPGDQWKPAILPKDTTLPPVKPPDDSNATQPGAAPMPLPLLSNDKDLPPIPDPLGGEPKPLTPPAPPGQGGPAKSSTPQAQASPEDPTKAQLKRLMDTFGKKDAPNKLTVEPARGILVAGAVVPAAKESSAPDKGLGHPIVPENSPWTLLWESADGHTTLTARLNKRLEFRIVCERVKMESPDGALLAIGKVAITGPGLKGSCNRLSISLTDDILVLEGKVELQIQQGSLSDLAIPMVELKGELISLRLQQLTGGGNPAAGAAASPIAPAPAPAPAPFNTSPLSPFTSPAPVLVPKNGQ